MSQELFIMGGLFVLAMLSGMSGLGVAFAAVPFLSLFYADLVRQVQPLTLLLNGATALFAGIGFARSGYVNWKYTGYLAIVAVLSMPVGAWLVHFIDQNMTWYFYFGAVIYLLYRLFVPIQNSSRSENIKRVLIAAVPISILAGMLGIGPGFLIIPVMIVSGFEVKKAAGINALAMAPASFAAFLPHLPVVQIDVWQATVFIIAGVAGAFVGARLSSRHISNEHLTRVFATLIVVMALYKVSTLIGE